MKKFRFELPQPPGFFEVEAESKEEAVNILENSDDITEYEYDGLMEVWQPDFEFISEE